MYTLTSNLVQIMGHKRMASSPLQHVRRSRRIANTHNKHAPTARADDREDNSVQSDSDLTTTTDDEYHTEGEMDSLSDDEEEGRSKTQNESDDKSEDSHESDAPHRTVTIIPHEKLRPLGGINYEDHRVHPNTLLYLTELKANNTRAWFKRHEKEYRRAAKDWEGFVETLMPKIIGFDSTVPELPPRDVIFRIHRDIRFSKDQRPYKSHFSAAFGRTGRRRPYACYYIHMDPGASYVGGGLWAPEPQTIQLIRESIDEQPGVWRQLVGCEMFRNTFLPRARGSVEKALKEFSHVNKEGALKTKPKNYTIDHPDIELLKLRNYHVQKKVDDEIFTTEDGQDQIIDTIRILQPYVTFLNSVIMPDPGAA